ncbi:MAG: asparagine synthase (glutamine-hydrolyzing) [Phycisphaerales bacterium]|nr:asparagine synthase (glutamine-hydrolyzing) [Phycisphaerales bacterium]
MLEKVAHRGPDGEGTWSDAAYGLAFAHSRLKVQDLTEAADQPMRASDDSVVLVYNGEIYNFRELREELRLDGATFSSSGDTEVLFELCRRDPELGFLPRLNGMFAFALWHASTQTLSLVRDRTGVKPLLYGDLPEGGLAFASEMNALRPILTDLAIAPEAVLQLLTIGFIAAPQSIFRQVRKLRPGHLLRYRGGRTEVQKWSPDPPRSSSVDDFSEACQVLRETLTDAVRTRLLADVPVGVFLSGGIDSAIVTAVASKVASGRVRSFSVGFPGHPFFDESHYAKAVAEMHGTDHVVLPLSLDEVQSIIPAVQDHLGEPFADSSALPTYLLSRLTSEHVTVALSGDGADELFAGYNRYAAATLIEEYGWLAKTPLYGLACRLIGRLPGRRERWLGGKLNMMKRAIQSMDPRLPHRYANWMRISDDRTLAQLLGSSSAASYPTDQIERLVQLLWHYRGSPKEDHDLNHHLRTEWQLSLPDDMLTKVDLMSMAHGLEVRSPFLDHRLVDQIFPMDWRWKLNGWRKKHLLIEAFKDDLPPSLHHRPKRGFEVPVGPWLRGPLNQMARELIHGDQCFFGPLLSRAGALKTVDEHRTGRADHSFCLWALVSLLAWQQRHAPEIALASKV